MRFKDTKGFTLIELVVALAILGLAINLGYDLAEYGLKSFSTGQEQAYAQRDVRFASERITRELRKATSIELPDPTLPRPSGYCYFYSDNTSVLHFVNEQSVDEPVTFGNAVITDPLNFDLSLRNNQLILVFTFREKDSFPDDAFSNDNQYYITSSIVLNNIAPFNVGQTLPISGSVVKFKRS